MFCFFQSNQHFALSLPSKHLLVFKTPWSSLQDMSWRCLEDLPWRCFEDMPWRRLEDISWGRLVHVFIVTIFCLQKRLQDVFKTTWNYILKMSWKTKNPYPVDAMKTSWRHVLKTSLRRLWDKQNFYWWYLYLTMIY